MVKSLAFLALLSFTTGITANPINPKPALSSMTIAVEGDVYRPGLYEVKSGANLKDALALAGGLAINLAVARITVERGPNKQLSFPAATLFQSRQNSSVKLKLEADDYIRVDTQPSNRPDSIMNFMAERKAEVGMRPSEPSSF